MITNFYCKQLRRIIPVVSHRIYIPYIIFNISSFNICNYKYPNTILTNFVALSLLSRSLIILYFSSIILHIFLYLPLWYHYDFSASNWIDMITFNRLNTGKYLLYLNTLYSLKYKYTLKYTKYIEIHWNISMLYVNNTNVVRI